MSLRKGCKCLFQSDKQFGKGTHTINDDLMVCKFLAYDTEGDRLSYSLSGGNPDFDDDGNSILFINRATGELFINDLDDLKLMRQDIIEPTLIVADQAGLKRKAITVDLRKWTHLLGILTFRSTIFMLQKICSQGLSSAI